MHPSQFQIRFDSNKYDITPEGQQTIEEVAKWFQDEDASFIAIIGHTDTAGSAAHNTELARRRAMAVHDALMATGKIPAGRIEAAWAGEEEQAIQTSNAVAEARNRVVNIYIDYNKPLP
jgi:outer membrane protein OmpA-like peptidoglycan-associated protein